MSKEMFREISRPIYFGIYPVDQVVSDRLDKFLKMCCAFNIFSD